MAINENKSFTEYVSVFWLLYFSKLAINWKNDSGVTICCHDVIIKLFWRCFVSLIKFSYCSKFHVSIIIGSGVLTIFFYKGLIRNVKIGNTLVWVLSNIWRLGQVRDTKFGPMSLIKWFWMLQNVRATVFTVCVIA